MTIPTSQPSFTEGNFAPESFSIPSDPSEFNYFLKDILELFARLINRKDTGQYEAVELQNNQTYPGADPQNKRMIFRRVVDCGALPNNANKTVAHGITSFSQITVTRLYGAATNPGTTAIPIPFANPIGVAESVALFIDATNVNITTGTDRTAYTSTFVVIEYYRV